MESQDEDPGPIPELIPLQNYEDKNNQKSKLKQLQGKTLLLRYLKGSDWLLLSAGTFFALLHGICFPLVTLILGHMTDILLSQAEQRCNNSNTTDDYLGQYNDEYEELSIENLLQNKTAGIVNPQQLLEIFSSQPTSVSQEEYEDCLSLLSAIIGCFVLIAAFLQPFCWDLCSSRRVYRLQLDLFHKLLHQEMIWYDTNKEKQIITDICRHVDQYQHGTGNKLGMLLQYSATCTAGLIVAFVANWRLTLLVFPMSFLCLVVPHLLDKVYLNLTSKGYTEAGQIAEDVFSNIQSDDDTDGHGLELNCYREALQAGQDTTLKQIYMICTTILAVYLVVSAMMAIALWNNWKLIEMGCLAPGAVATVFFSVIVVMLSINKVLSFGAFLMSAKQSAHVLQGIIDQAPAVEIQDGCSKSHVATTVQFKDVSFSYPTAYKNQTIHNINFEAKAGTSMAFLDVSGRAPRSIMDLLLGFYKPVAGKILIDGTVSCPQAALAVISFDPQLFSCLSVLDNIQLGTKDVEFNQVLQICVDVAVHGYIPGLTLGYDTLVGESFTADLKQRITLARAAIRNPNILVIDDITSQRIMDIQGNRRLIEAFHKVMDGHTTIVFSQRLPIIQHANTICILENGVLCEIGSHSDLMDKGEIYRKWVTKQQIGQDNNAVLMRKITENGTEEKQRKMSQFVFEPEFLNQKELPDSGRCSMICLNSPEWPWILFGFLSHVITGLGLPVVARLFGNIFVPREELPRTSQFWGYMVLSVGAIVGVSFWLQSISAVTCVEKALNRLRIMTFSVMLKQAEEMKMDKISLKKLHYQLTDNLIAIRKVTAPRICEIVGASTSMVAAMVAAFLHGWKMELVLLLVFPAIALAFHVKTRTVIKQQQHYQKLMKPANQVMTECIEKIRTLRVLGGEEKFETLYAKKLTDPYRVTRKHATVYAVVYALAESGVHVLYAASFKYGFFLIRSQEMGLVSVYRIFFALGICIISMSHLLIYRQEWTCAVGTLQRLFKLVRGENTQKNSKTD